MCVCETDRETHQHEGWKKQSITYSGVYESDKESTDEKGPKRHKSISTEQKFDSIDG